MARLTDAQWSVVKADYEVKNLSNRELAAIHGVSESGIRKKAEQDSWQKGASAHLISANLQIIKDLSDVSAQSAHLSAQHIDAISEEVKFRIDNDRDLQAIQNIVNSMARNIDNPAHALALMTATVKHREARLGKSPDVAVQINNTMAISKIEREIIDHATD